MEAAKAVGKKKEAKAKGEPKAKKEAKAKGEPKAEKEPKAATMEMTEQVVVVEREEEEEVEVEEIEYEGVKYFRSAKGVVYDMLTSEEVGRWNDRTKSIEVE